MTKEEILQKCIVDGTVIKLPKIQLERKLYQDVAKSLQFIGGKWKGGKIQGFIFNTDPSELLKEVASGNKRNIKKEFQFFETPEIICDRLIELAEINVEHAILEPSAGRGAIVNAIHRELGGSGFTVYGYELMPTNVQFLEKICGFRLIGSDFLTECETYFDRIIANPPFSKNQDIDHVIKMYDHLKEGGRVVSIVGTSWINGSQKKQIEFRNWLDEVGAEVIDIERGAFKESGTMVGGKIVIINKKQL